MGMRAVQESLASCVLGRLAFSEICEHFLEQVLCKHLKKSSQKRQGRTWPGREHRGCRELLGRMLEAGGH